MKKFMLYTILFGFITSCNVDDVESNFTVASETAQDDTDCVADDPPSILGKTYIRSSFVIDTQ